MRKLRHQFNHHYGELRNRPNRLALQQRLTKALGQPCRLIPTSKRGGRDSQYHVQTDRGRVAMVRMFNPYRSHSPPSRSRLRSRGRYRLWREWGAYQRLGPLGLAPCGLYREADVVVCSYVPGRRVSDLAVARPQRFWQLARQVVRGLSQLHANRVVHMDASMSNVILHEETRQPVFIDFEHMPATWLTRRQRQAFDYLHMVDISLKMMPSDLRAQTDRWAAILDQHVPKALRTVDTTPLHGALHRLPRQPDLLRDLREVFVHIQDVRHPPTSFTQRLYTRGSDQPRQRKHDERTNTATGG